MPPTTSYPLIKDLPLLAVADDWKWQSPMTGQATQKLRTPTEFWIGIASDGRRWIVKMRGSTYAYREHVYAALAQCLGLSCQSSIFLRLPPDAPPLANCHQRSRNQLAIWLLEKHQDGSCSIGCPLVEFRMRFKTSQGTDVVEVILNSKIKNMADWARGEILGYLCGQFEPGGIFCTRDHELVLIDNECMWNTPQWI